jgi:hypothetical protein
MKTVNTMPPGGKRAGAGRPRKYGRAALGKPLVIRGTNAQREAWERAARTKGIPLSEWVRETLDSAAAPR